MYPFYGYILCKNANNYYLIGGFYLALGWGAVSKCCAAFTDIYK